MPMSKKSTEFFQSVRIFATVFVRIFEKAIWEHWPGYVVAVAKICDTPMTCTQLHSLHGIAKVCDRPNAHTHQ